MAGYAAGMIASKGLGVEVRPLVEVWTLWFKAGPLASLSSIPFVVLVFFISWQRALVCSCFHDC